MFNKKYLFAVNLDACPSFSDKVPLLINTDEISVGIEYPSVIKHGKKLWKGDFGKFVAINSSFVTCTILAYIKTCTIFPYFMHLLCTTLRYDAGMVIFISTGASGNDPVGRSFHSPF